MLTTKSSNIHGFWFHAIFANSEKVLTAHLGIHSERIFIASVVVISKKIQFYFLKTNFCVQ